MRYAEAIITARMRYTETFDPFILEKNIKVQGHYSTSGNTSRTALAEEESASCQWTATCISSSAHRLTNSDREVVLSPTGRLTDEIICAAQVLLLQIFPNMAGLQPPVLQKVLQFHVHSGEFVQIVHVRNNHWCVASTVGCESGVIHVYDSLYRSLSRETLCLIASMVYSPSSALKITMINVLQ